MWFGTIKAMKKVLNGRELAGFIKQRQAKQVRGLRQAWSVQPRLAIVTDSDSSVIQTYMRLKQRYGADILIDVEVHHVPSAELSNRITLLNQRYDVQGIIVQLPLVDSNQTDAILSLVDPAKDVDGLHPQTNYDPATPTAINWLLAGYGIELMGRPLAIVGAGRLVGAPLARMWQQSGYDVTVFDNGDDLGQLVTYPVVVTATGVPGLIQPAMVGRSTIVVDAGTAVEDGQIVGDIAPAVRERADICATPLRGGVGPLTVAALFDNLIRACLQQARRHTAVD